MWCPGWCVLLGNLVESWSVVADLWYLIALIVGFGACLIVVHGIDVRTGRMTADGVTTVVLLVLAAAVVVYLVAALIAPERF